jgi:phosphate acetyltransferase
VARANLPNIVVPNHDRFHAIMQRCKGLEPLCTAIVHPVQADALQAANDAVKAGLIIPVLIGPIGRIKATAKGAKIDISKWETMDTEHSHEAAKPGP